MNTILYRLFYLVLGWGWVGLIYSIAARLQPTGQQLEPSYVDNLLPFSPHAIWLYLSFFVIIPFAFWYAPYYRVRWMSLCMVISSTLAGICYLLFPTTLSYPSVEGGDVSTRLLQQLMQIDSSQNCFPSLHVALTLLVTAGCLHAQRIITNTLLILWALGICFSIIFLRRHLFVDLVGGTVLAAVIGYLMSAFISANPEVRHD